LAHDGVSDFCVLASQVVHTIPRGVGAPPITAANVPPIAAAPAPGALITFTGGQVNIPN
jgi:hydroxybutyrate-dimer hydrolase